MAIIEVEEQKQREMLEQENLLYMQKQREIRKAQMERAAAKEAREKGKSARWYGTLLRLKPRGQKMFVPLVANLYI